MALTHGIHSGCHAETKTIYIYFTKIDLSMCFYWLKLDEDSKHFTKTIHPNGTLLEYNQLPMELHISPDACQMSIEGILDGVELTVYIDDIGYWYNGTYKEHMA